MDDGPMTLEEVPLDGRWTRLEPLAPSLREPLRAALAGQQADWALMAGLAGNEGFDPWWARVTSRETRAGRITYAVRRRTDDRIVGTTSFIDISPASRRVEIGMSFLQAEARSGPTNPDMKLAMLRHAFGAGAVRVELLTDARNHRSQAAIAKLGAVREGRLRRHRITWTGHVRDTVVFSIVDEDWPAVRARLEARLDAISRADAAGP